MQRLVGKVALVTGSGRQGGLGAAIASRLSEEGAAVVVTDLPTGDQDIPADRVGSESELEAIAAAIRASGGRALSHPLDVREEATVIAAIDYTVKEFGGLDILINNAGIGFMMEPLVDMPIARWRTVLDVNLTGAFLCTQHASRQMIAQGRGGRIINIASVAAKSGSVHLAAYAASKHGMIGLTRSAAIELGAHQITVNAVCPNHVTTGLGAVQNNYRAAQRGQTVDEYLAEMRGRIPLGRVGLATDTAKACAFLCSEEAAYITGEAMNVSGGQEMH
ncbi:MAG: SDR family oxidoreductase [Gammaproteobacteria bacterium]|jgi:NAD(P)-dependent dehydrogenase (short-subunit alcohol dehydrogenase family)|nr:SDR family oxidoreductase [Gammaproteobacteria bacterium]